jgi:hypothetical protein
MKNYEGRSAELVDRGFSARNGITCPALPFHGPVNDSRCAELQGYRGVENASRNTPAAFHRFLWGRCGMLKRMENLHHAITPETEQVLQQSGGPLQIAGQQGNYVVMRLDVYDAMLGISDDEDAETLASVRRGLADVDAGRTHDANEAFDRLESRYAS